MTDEDAILKSVLEEYVYRRFEVLGCGDPEWFRHFLADQGWDLVLVARSTEFQLCSKGPIGIVTNCDAMKCEADGCAMAKPQEVVSLDDLGPYGAS